MQHSYFAYAISCIKPEDITGPATPRSRVEDRKRRKQTHGSYGTCQSSADRSIHMDYILANWSSHLPAFYSITQSKKKISVLCWCLDGNALCCHRDEPLLWLNEVGGKKTARRHQRINTLPGLWCVDGTACTQKHHKAFTTYLWDTARQGRNVPDGELPVCTFQNKTKGRILLRGATKSSWNLRFRENASKTRQKPQSCFTSE